MMQSLLSYTNCDARVCFSADIFTPLHTIFKRSFIKQLRTPCFVCFVHFDFLRAHCCLQPGLAYCRHLSTVRTHLSALVNHAIVEPDAPRDAYQGLTADVWKTFLQDCTVSRTLSWHSKCHNLLNTL